MFSERLKRSRGKAGLTQEGLARAAGVSIDTIRKLEQTDADPKLSTVAALAKALGVGCEELTGIKGKKS